MFVCGRPLLLLLVLALCGLARAIVNDDRIAARTACYKDCLSRDGWDPVCVSNPAFPNRTTHGGGDSVWPNECAAQCMAQYCKYAEFCNLKTKQRVKLPSKCYKRVWDIYIALDVDVPECQACSAANKVTKPPPFKAIPEAQCLKGCADRDGWAPVCVKNDSNNKRRVFGNGCAAQCASFLSTPLYKVKKINLCKRQFLKTGKLSGPCATCPRGKVDNSLFTDSDRIVAREFCYKACISRDGWDPVCAWNPAFPKPTTHGGGDSVWPNRCTYKCMNQYCKYAESCNLKTKYRIKLPLVCRRDLFSIYYLTTNEPSAPQNVIDRCNTCGPPSAR